MNLPKEQARLRAKATKELGKAMTLADYALQHLFHNRIQYAEMRVSRAFIALDAVADALDEWKRIRDYKEFPG